MQGHIFGGDWTSEKLERINKYLHAYATIMNKQKYRFAYIDAFAGTGYRNLKKTEPEGERLLPVFSEKESNGFIEGSARIALQVRPTFDRYIFIEKDVKRVIELGKLKDEYPSLKESIQIVNAEANGYLRDLCASNWSKNRAVLFLDPYGMQVEWETISCIAKTKAIDLWILFPLGVAVNRLLKKDGKIDFGWRRRLDALFGCKEWYDVFYKTEEEIDLFGRESRIHKVGDFKSISDYFVKRLKTLFPGVAENPLPLINSKNNPMFLLCFAAGNDRGAKTAIKIAQDILKE